MTPLERLELALRRVQGRENVDVMSPSSLLAAIIDEVMFINNYASEHDREHLDDAREK